MPGWRRFKRLIRLLAIFRVPLPYKIALLDQRSPLHRSGSGLGPSVYLDTERVYALNFEVPSGGGVGTARAMAQTYSEFASGGQQLVLQEQTLQ